MGTLIEVEDRHRVRFITLAREGQLNALNSQLIGELDELLEATEMAHDVGCVVLRGAGSRAFCAGADLDEMLGVDATEAQLFIDGGHRLMARISDLNVPTIAAVDGWALGGGMELALACHLLISTDQSRFGLPEAKIGCMPGFGGTQRVFRALPHALAMRMLLTGEPIGASEAWEGGLLSYPPLERNDFDEHIETVASAIAAGSRPGNQRILAAARAATKARALELEAALATAAIGSPDGQEGIRSFAERRAPNFRETTDV